jgi:predicted site-specific integrase-resolvase
MTDTQPSEMTMIEAAALLGVTLPTLDRLVLTGKIRKGRLVINNRSRAVVNGEDVRRVKAERANVQWENAKGEG